MSPFLPRVCSCLKTQAHPAAASRVGGGVHDAAAVAGDERFFEPALLPVHWLAHDLVEPIIVRDKPLAGGFIGIEVVGVFGLEPQCLLASVGGVERFGSRDVYRALPLKGLGIFSDPRVDLLAPSSRSFFSKAARAFSCCLVRPTRSLTRSCAACAGGRPSMMARSMAWTMAARV
jgi:hypothetical protein